MAKKFNNPAELLNTVCKKFHDDNALIQPDFKRFSNRIVYKSLTYGEFGWYVNEYIKILRARGVKKGDRILLLLPFSFELYTAIVAIMAIGATAVFVEPWMMKRKYRVLINDIKLDFVICERKLFILLRFFTFFGKSLLYIPIPKLVKAIRRREDMEFEEVDINEAAIITFTTGSGDVPKKVVRSYGDLNCQLKQVALTIPPDFDSTDFVTFPNLILFNLSQGATSVIPHRSYRGEILNGGIYRKVIDELKVGRIFMSPRNIETIFEKRFGNQVRSIYTGGGPITLRCIKSIRNIEKVRIFYGSTEIEPISTIELNEYIKSDKCRGIPVGKPINGVKIRINCFDNNIGEIEARYDRCNESTYSDRWFKTGDVGYIDEGGNICLMGRMNNIPKYDNGYIYPFEVQRIVEKNRENNTVLPLYINKKLVIIVSPQSDRVNSIIRNFLLEKGIREFHIISLDKIPRDPRHHSKIDMKEIKKKFSNY